MSQYVLWVYLIQSNYYIFLQDGRADVVANDAGDRVTPAVVAYSENEEVLFPSYFCFVISKNYMHCNILLFSRWLDWQQNKVE